MVVAGALYYQNTQLNAQVNQDRQRIATAQRELQSYRRLGRSHRGQSLAAVASRDGAASTSAPNVADDGTDPIGLLAHANTHAALALDQLRAATADLNLASKTATDTSRKSMDEVRDKLAAISQSIDHVWRQAGG